MKNAAQTKQKKTALNLRVAEAFKEKLIQEMIRHNQTAPIAANLSEFAIYMMKRGMDQKS